MIDSNLTLASIATSHPGASRVFQRHHLDFCCGGDRSLRDACAERGLDADAVAAEVDREPAGAGDESGWDEKALPLLIDHILQRYHEPLRKELPRLRDLARKVESVHAGHARCPHGLADQLDTVIAEVEEHLAKEEQILFPMIRNGMGSQAGMPVSVMISEHDRHGENLALLRERTGGFAAPDDACTSWQALYLGLEQLELDLMQHIHLENAVLFPRALAGQGGF